MSVTDPFGLVGQVLDGQFRVDKLVGEGGFSAVYRGHHQGLGEPIALKCLKLPPQLPTSLIDTFVNRFRDESRILYRLSQGNLHIVRSIAAGTTQSKTTGMLVPYMVLEWLEGRSVQNDFTVRRTLGQTGRALDVVLKLFETAADGLAYAHAQGVAHRDLNPGNLFLAQTQQGLKMKVLDFGVAKLMHDGALDMGPRQHTVGQIKIFAPAYGAPEQFDDRIGKVSAASDVYSFALVLIEALRDKSINEGQHIGEFAAAACDPGKRPTPRFYGVDVPEEVEAAFARATRLDPKERWQTVGDFWQSLTIANKVAVERRYETAARETPPLAMGNVPAPPPPAAKTTAKNNAMTMPLGSVLPDLKAQFGANAPRPRTPTTIGIPPPVGSPALPRPGSSPAIPRPPTPQAHVAARTVAFAATEPGPPPPSSRRNNSSIPTSKAQAPNPEEVVDLPSQDPLPEEDEDEATKVHAPAPEMLRTLAFQQAGAANPMQQARAQADAMIAAQRAQAAAAPPPPAAGRPPYVNPNEEIEEPPDSGGTLMMAPQARQQAMSSTLAMQSPVAAPPPPYQPPPPLPQDQATRAMPAMPVVAAPGMQGIPGARGTPPRGMPAFGQGSQIVAPQPQPPPPPQQPQFQAPPPPQQSVAFAQPPPPSIAQPSVTPVVPSKPLPVVPILAGLGVLAIGGIILGGLALRSRKPAPEVPVAVSSTALTAVPVETTASAAPTAPPVATTTEEPAPTVAVAPSATEEAADAAPAPTTTAAATTTATTATAPTATAVATATPPTNNTTIQPGMALPTPKPSADPNAFSASSAREKLSNAAGVLAFCKQPGGGVTGPGNASVTFAPDGSVSSVAVDPPYAGTKEGDCVSAQFRRAKIAPFTGSPQTLKFPFEVPK